MVVGATVVAVAFAVVGEAVVVVAAAGVTAFGEICGADVSKVTVSSLISRQKSTTDLQLSNDLTALTVTCGTSAADFPLAFHSP